MGKYQGYYLLSVGFAGTVLNQFLKMTFRIPRPWVRDPSLSIVEAAREGADGFSFPSGHTQTAIGLYGGMARANKGLLLRVLCIAACLLVPLSRMYLGVHTPADVGVSAAISLVMVFVAYPLFQKAQRSPKVMYAILLSLTALLAAYLCYVCLYPFPAEVYEPTHLPNLLSARKNGFTLAGCALGLLVAYTADLKWVKFDTRAVWWVQIIKAVGGLALVVAAKELLRLPLEAILPADSWARLVRYFAMVIVGGVLWPMAFAPLSKLSKRR